MDEAKTISDPSATHNNITRSQREWLHVSVRHFSFLEDIQMPQRNVYEKRYKFTQDRKRYEIIMDFDFSILLLPSPLWWRCKMWNISDSRRYKIGFTSDSSYRFVSSFCRETFYNLITALSLLRENDHMSLFQQSVGVQDLAGNIHTHEDLNQFSRAKEKEDDELHRQTSWVCTTPNSFRCGREKRKMKIFSNFQFSLLLLGFPIRFRPLELIQIVKPKANKCPDLSTDGHVEHWEMCETEMTGPENRILKMWKSPLGRKLINMLLLDLVMRLSGNVWRKKFTL